MTYRDFFPTDAERARRDYADWLPTPKALLNVTLGWHGGRRFLQLRELGGTAIDINALVQVTDLFPGRWNPLILAILGEQPLRIRALTRTIESHIGEHVDDNTVTRGLRGLTRSGLIRADGSYIGKRKIKIYCLTAKGYQRWMAYDVLTTAYAYLHQPDETCDAECFLRTLRKSRDTD